MKYVSLLASLVLMMVVAAGCLNESPLATSTGNSSDDPIRGHMLPFHATETNTIEIVCNPFECDPPIPVSVAIFEGGGQATYLGNYTIFTDSQVFVFEDPLVQITQSVMTAANGDELWWDGDGTATQPTPTTVIFSGTFTFTGGTGRFENATGGGTFAGTADLAAATGQYVMDGEISRPTPPS